MEEIILPRQETQLRDKINNFYHINSYFVVINAFI